MLAKEITKMHYWKWEESPKRECFGSRSKSFKAKVVVNNIKVRWRIQVIQDRKCPLDLPMRKKDVTE